MESFDRFWKIKRGIVCLLAGVTVAATVAEAAPYDAEIVLAAEVTSKADESANAESATETESSADTALTSEANQLANTESTSVSTEQKTVRVGYVNVLNYEEGGEGEYKRGAGYEYLQKISYLTGWNYEYVYGTFKECYDMLASGEIDLFGNVSYTPERAEEINFSSYPQGEDNYWLYTAKGRTDLSSGNVQKLNGCKIGVSKGTYQETLLQEWLDNNHIRAQIVECAGYDDMMTSLDSGKVDAIAAADLSINYDYPVIIGIGTSDYYFGVSKSRPDLLPELNEALYEIQNAEADYNSLLTARYYYKAASGISLNEEEKVWLEAHDNTVRLGYFADNLPFCGEENGELAGILATVMNALEEDYGIRVEARPYTGLNEMKEALNRQEIDVAGPVIGDFYLTEQDHLVLTDSIVETTPVIIYKGSDYHDAINRIAATDNAMFGPGIVSILFPEAEIYPCDSLEACLQAVADGKAGSTLIPSSRINILNANPLMENLSFAEIANRKNVALLASKENRRAASIVNKGIEQSSDVLNGVVMAQHSMAEESISLKKFISQYAWLLIGIAAMIIAVLGVLLRRLSVSQKQLMAALEDARNANSANVAKTTFLNNMSHDIRTPMNAIIGFTNIALKQNPSPEIQNCLEKISESSEYLLSLINDVLDISRIESGKIKYNPVPVNITAVTDDVLNIAKGFLIDRDLQIKIRRAKLDTPYVLADEIRIREVLINIISNSVKFTNDGGMIFFETDYRKGKNDDEIVVSYRIEDTGVGMDKQFQTQIFDEFSQEDAGARTQYKGTGLGMTITKRYVDLMDGTISVESQKGVGSSFVVEIPLKLTDPVDNEEEKEPVRGKDLKGVRILMAEDNDLNAELAQALLEEQGMQITRAVDGQDTVDMFRSHAPHSFDLILMDIMMPRMNGYEATRAIRAMEDRPDGQEIPIVAMTANAFAEDVQAALDAGMNAHLAKPIVMERVLQVISENVKETGGNADAEQET